MDAFVSRKRRRPSASGPIQNSLDDEDSTEFKLALLASLHPDLGDDLLLDALLAKNGNVQDASVALEAPEQASPRKKYARTIGYQSSLTRLITRKDSSGDSITPKTLTKKGKTLYLYDPADVEIHTPCSIIHNFLPTEDADALLKELLQETPTFRRETFQLFDRTVESPHSMAFYVDSLEEAQSQQTDYVYNGSNIPDVRQTLPQMRAVASRVQETVNAEIQRRIKTFYPGGQKLRFQTPKPWSPNASFVNCYSGGAESVGYHSDQLTYLGPRAVIGSLSLGVAREFRVRRIVPRDNPDTDPKTNANANASNSDPATTTKPTTTTTTTTTPQDVQGQISIHLPHNSLLVMHAEMQEEWKHAIAPAPAIDPHPVAGNKRLNVTYRWYRESLHPRYTPRCRCGVPTVLRCVQRRSENKGRYMWMCHTAYTPGKKGCGFFEWARFDDDGDPPWAAKGEAGGIEDRLKRDGATVKEGTLRNTA